MVKLFGIAFTALLVCAHLADLQGDAYLRPLSLFRDFEPAWMGYALFGVLMAIGLETVRTAYRVQAVAPTIVYLVATGLLTIVAVTPSFNSLHSTCALLAMGGVFIYHAALLYRADCIFWLIMHLLTPSVLMMASQLESYGIWQKGMILYFLMATVVHQHVLANALPKHRPMKVKRLRISVGRKQAG
jgi:hypothetical protein